MNTMKMIKLSTIERNSLDSRSMAAVKGGASETCGCACYYRNTGGASIDDNMHANRLGGLWSPQITKDMKIITLDGKTVW